MLRPQFVVSSGLVVFSISQANPSGQVYKRDRRHGVALSDLLTSV